jgi:5-methyltetrahydropteroyltriglutamate--homocysteine methyltransferase
VPSPVSRSPLELLPEDCVPSLGVPSLGVVDVGDPESEDVDELVARIDRAVETVDIDDLAISTNGGFRRTPG